MKFAMGMLIIGLVCFNILFSIQAVALNLDFYSKQWIKLDVPKSAGIALEDLKHIGTILKKYFLGHSSSAQVFISVEDTERDLYRENEIAHLEDVRDLFKLGFSVKTISMAFMLLGFTYILVCKTDQMHLKIIAISKALKMAGIILILITLIMVLPAALNFTNWWTKFHLVTFRNDLWRLDPYEDYLIRIFPESFFFSAAQQIAIYSAAITLSYILFGLLLRFFISYFTSNDGKHYL